jgi:hypothetical protein
MIFDHDGPGLPTGPEQGTTWSIEREKVRVTGYDQCIDQLNLGISSYGHYLTVGGWTIDLIGEIGPDRLINLEVGNVPLIAFLIIEVVNGAKT